MSKEIEKNREMLYWYGQYKDAEAEAERTSACAFIGSMIVYIYLLATIGQAQIFPVAESAGVKVLAGIVMGVLALIIPIIFGRIGWYVAAVDCRLVKKYDNYLKARTELRVIQRKEEERD